VLLLVTGLLTAGGLAGCSSSPAEEAPSSFAPATTQTPTATPTPSASWPVRIADDPTWTANQLAAVQVVDRYNEIRCIQADDPVHADFLPLIEVATDPQYSIDVKNTINMANIGRYTQGGCIVPVKRMVAQETVVSGRPEIEVRQCNEDPPDSKAFENGVEVSLGNPRVEYVYNVQWLETEQQWRVALLTKGSTTC
jgi:hypothetical protein